MKLRQPDAEKSAILVKEYVEYDSKHQAQKEKDLAACDVEIDKAKIAFDFGQLHGANNLWELRGKLEAPQFKKIKINQDYLNGKDKIFNELKKINFPYIISDVEDLMKEYSRIDSLRTFKILVDKEDAASEKGARIFKASHNYFTIDEAQLRIISFIDTLRNMETHPLVEIQKTFNKAVEEIPEIFEEQESKGGGSLRDYLFENKPKTVTTEEAEILWLHQVQYLADLKKKVEDYEVKKKDGEVGELVSKKHRGPIEIIMD